LNKRVGKTHKKDKSFNHMKSVDYKILRDGSPTSLSPWGPFNQKALS